MTEIVPSPQAAWQEYVNAAQRLDAVRREATAIVTEQTAARQAAREELATVRTRLALQQARLQDIARQTGSVPVLTPGYAELNAAQAALGVPTSPAGVRAALRTALATVDAADVTLSGAAGASVRANEAPMLRNALVYGGFALAGGLLQVVAFLLTGEGPAFALALGCSLVLPLITFGFAWSSLGLFSPAPGTPVNRTPGLGAAVSLLALLPLLLLMMLAVAGRRGG